MLDLIRSVAQRMPVHFVWALLCGLTLHASWSSAKAGALRGQANFARHEPIQAGLYLNPSNCLLCQSTNAKKDWRLAS